MLKFWGMQSTPLLPSLSGPLWAGVVAPDRVLSMDQIELNHVIIIMLCRQHGYPWPSLATFPYHSSLLAGPQGYIPYPHRAAVSRFELVCPAFARPCEEVHRRTSLMSLSCMSGWSNFDSFRDVGCCLQDSFKTYAKLNYLNCLYI